MARRWGLWRDEVHEGTKSSHGGHGPGGARRNIFAGMSATRKTSKAGRRGGSCPAEEEFFNREISWLAFNERVLQEAEDEEMPLIERMRSSASSPTTSTSSSASASRRCSAWP